MISTRFGVKDSPPKEDEGGFKRPAAEGKSDEPVYQHHQGVYTAHRLKAREAGDGGGRASAGSSDYEKPNSAAGDSGRGPSAKDTSTESSCSPQSRQDKQRKLLMGSWEKYYGIILCWLIDDRHPVN